MALVAYDNSDSSDYDEECNESLPVILKSKIGVVETREPTIQSESFAEKCTTEELEAPQSLFNQLPQPNHKKNAVVEEDDEFLHKKETSLDVKPKSKITVPSLRDFMDVKDTVPSARPKVSNGIKSGLLSMLPQPKHSSISTATSKMLIPQAVLQKPQPSTAKRKASHPTASKKTTPETKGTDVNPHYSDDSDEDVQNDFFSINKPVEVPLEELPLDLELPSSSKNIDVPAPKPRSIESYFKQDSIENNVEEVNIDNEIDSAMYNEQGAQFSDNTSTVSSEIALDDEAILKLCGSRGKRKREEIQIVDVNQQEVLADARKWLLKGLMEDTSKRVSSSKRRGNEPTSQQKRKHQITYLAHQAKANEIELQNQWANNRMTKRQTQSKYGF